MSIETRLRDTLERAAEDAPDHERVLARALADATEEPVRTRRRWAVPALAAAAVLAVVGVGVAVVSDGTRPRRRTPARLVPPRAGRGSAPTVWHSPCRRIGR